MADNQILNPNTQRNAERELAEILHDKSVGIGLVSPLLAQENENQYHVVAKCDKVTADRLSDILKAAVAANGS